MGEACAGDQAAGIGGGAESRARSQWLSDGVGMAKWEVIFVFTGRRVTAGGITPGRPHS